MSLTKIGRLLGAMCCAALLASCSQSGSTAMVTGASGSGVTGADVTGVSGMTSTTDLSYASGDSGVTGPPAPPADPLLPAASDFGSQVTPCSFGTYAGQAVLPDSHCTPGSSDPNITASNLNDTICKRGYVLPKGLPASISNPERQGALSAYGLDAKVKGYRYDHLVGMSIGGAPNVAANLWPLVAQGPYSAIAKSKLESKLHRLVCRGQLSLGAAQHAEASNWIAAYQTYVGSL